MSLWLWYWCKVCLLAVLDKSLALEKFSRRNDSEFSRSSWRNEFSSLILLLIFKSVWKNFSFPSRFLRFLSGNSLSPLDCQDFWEKFLFLFSIFEILEKKFPFSSRFSRHWRKISPSPLDWQDFGAIFLFLLSIIDHFHFHSNFQLVSDFILTVCHIKIAERKIYVFKCLNVPF